MNIQSYAPGWLDHSLFVLFGIAWPMYGYYSYRRHWRLLASGVLTRQSAYRTTMAIQWSFAVACMALWLGLGRDPVVLGLGWRGGWMTLAAAVLAVAAIAALVLQFRALTGDDPERRALVDKHLEGLEPLLPHTRAELRTFYATSFTAGVVEELLWRGFLLWYLGQFMPLWVAVFLAAALFGLGHAYQGLDGMPKVALIGLFLTALYLLSGSLWLSMLAHLAIDAVQGHYIQKHLARVPAPAPA